MGSVASHRATDHASAGTAASPKVPLRNVRREYAFMQLLRVGHVNTRRICGSSLTIAREPRIVTTGDGGKGAIVED